MKRATCYCHAYPFPHRLGGGKCTEATFADWYSTNRADLCATCSLAEHVHGSFFCLVVNDDRKGCAAFHASQSQGKVVK